jgi:hypothetical protein
MTTAQEKRFYWPRWQAACRANAWRMRSGRLELADTAEEPANTVIAAARHLAEQHHRAPTLDDLRHATHLAACGRDCGHARLSNRELTRWGWLMRLLIDPNDLEAMNHWQHPELDEESRLDARIRQAPEAYVNEICRSRFDAANWRGLDLHSKRALVMTLSNRTDHWHRPFSTPKERAV